MSFRSSLNKVKSEKIHLLSNLFQIMLICIALNVRLNGLYDHVVSPLFCKDSGLQKM